MRLRNIYIYIYIYIGHFKHRYDGSSISLCNCESMIEMGPPMSENQLKESQSCAASLQPPRRGRGSYKPS